MTMQDTANAGSQGAAMAPEIRKITTADLIEALRLGYQDFLAKPSHIAFLCVLYPIIGLVISRIALNNDLLPLIYPLATGYALVGPICALGLYELSRRREQGVGLLVLFAAWIATAFGLYESLLGGAPVDDVFELLGMIFGTANGLKLLVIGSGVGFVYAAIVLTFGVVSFPILLDRNIGIVPAVQTSARAVLGNPIVMMTWGFIVALTLLVATIPLFIGLIVALPVLGHATWHLYRRLIV